jgi:hypothetical protein
MELLINRLLRRSYFTFIFLAISMPALLHAASFGLQNFNPSNQTVDVMYDSEDPIAGFQFDVEGLVLSGGASGGAAENAGFSVNAGSSVVLGFSFTGAEIPAGSGLLTTLSYSEIGADEACITNTIATAPGGSSEYESSGSCSSTSVSLDGSLSLGLFDPSGSLEVIYDFGGDVAGFQFDVTGLTLTGASGGAAGDAGFTVQAGGATVIGFSFSGATVAAGGGVLTVLNFSDITADSAELSLGNFGTTTNSEAQDYITTASGSIVHDTDCAGNYYGDTTIDDCGVNSIIHYFP